MTQATLHDALILARALRQVSAGARASACAAILRRARRAQAYRQRTGHAHPELGDGSVGSAVLMGGTPMAPADLDADFAHCLTVAIAQITAPQSGCCADTSLAAM